jgi:membrane protein
LRGDDTRVRIAIAEDVRCAMSRRPSSLASDLALIAVAAIATLAVQRHLSKPSHPIVPAIDRKQPIAPLGRANPLKVVSRRWKEILFCTFDRINQDRILATAAGVVFYGLLAIFPAITALVSSYGLLADPSTISDNLESLALMLPGGAFAIVQDEIGRVLAKGSSSLSVAFVFGMLLAIWSANAGVKAILDALNVAHEQQEQRSFIRLNLVSLAFTIAALAAVLVMVGAVIGVPLALEQVGLVHHAELFVQVGRWPVLALVLLAALLVLYRYGPSRDAPRWRWLAIGAVAAVVLWLIGSALLSWYLSDFANYTATYGSLGAAIGLMTWMWMSAIIILVGAELNSEIERQAGAGTAQDSLKSAPARHGNRRSTATAVSG